MRKKMTKALVAGGVTLAVLVPAASAFAAYGDPGPHNDAVEHVCTGDQAMDRVQARDGTGPYHDEIAGDVVPATDGNHYRSGPLDGTGNQWRSGR